LETAIVSVSRPDFNPLDNGADYFADLKPDLGTVKATSGCSTFFR
jgi:hypothetical protein